jgi:hypothetical protein
MQRLGTLGLLPVGSGGERPARRDHRCGVRCGRRVDGGGPASLAAWGSEPGTFWSASLSLSLALAGLYNRGQLTSLARPIGASLLAR